MITHALVDRFLEGVKGQALREGTRYAREARVGDLIGSGEGVSTVVRGRTDDFERRYGPRTARSSTAAAVPPGGTHASIRWRQPSC